MIRWAFLFIFCLCQAILIPITDDTVYGQPFNKLRASRGGPSGVEGEHDLPYILADLNYELYPDFSRVIFASNEKIEFVSYELKDPYRIVIDLVGVVFCELEEHADYQEGLVKSIDVVKTSYAQRPSGLDEFFYAVDYIIITPLSKSPYTVSATEGGKVVVVDINRTSAEKKPEHKVSSYAKATEDKPPYAKATGGKQSTEEPEEMLFPETEEALPIIKHNLIDYIHYEVLDDASLVIIASNNEIRFTSFTRYFPRFGIVLKPAQDVFTDLQEKARLNHGAGQLIHIIRDKDIRRPVSLDRYFYPVKYIVVEPLDRPSFDVYSNEEENIWVLELSHDGLEAEIAARRDVPVVEEEEELPKEEEILPEKETPPTPEKEERLTRQEIMKVLRDELKREGFLKEEKLAAETKDRGEAGRTEAARMAESIRQDILEDMVVKGKGILSLSRAQEIAFENSAEAKTAKEGVRLARLKKREAFRALFPQLKLKASHTTGDVLGVDFIEEIYGVQTEQPIYQGRRLINTYKQSKVNLKLAKARYQKIRNDLNLKVAEAYYNTVMAVMNIRLQQKLLEETEKVLRLARSRHKVGLSTDLEILNVESQHNQVKFQLASAERDLALSRFKLQQAMNLDISKEKVDIGEVDTELQFKVLEVDLYKCLELASDNQPDILVNKLLVDSNRYGERIARGKSKLKIDMTGFLGQSGSHFETEDRKLDKDWNIGIKVSKPFGANTLSYAFTKEETSRKVGQTDRTGSTVNAGEFAILDAMNVAPEIREAKVNKLKAQNELIEARRQIALEVKEAYYSYQEAIIQVKNSLEKVKFQEEAVKVTRAQAELNEALQSQMLEALTKLTDERSVYIKALSDYNLSLSKLNRAIGIADYFSLD